MAKTKKIVDPDSEESQSRMTFGDHLEELRKRIILALAGSVFGVVVGIYYMYDIVFYLLRPYKLALTAHFYPGNFALDKPAAGVLLYLGIGMKAGLILSSPWIIYQIWMFVGAGLYARERKIVYRYIGPSALLFLLGIAFFYFIVLPLSLNFFVGFTDKTSKGPITPTWLETKLMHLTAEGIDFSKIPAGDKADYRPIPVVSSDIPAPDNGEGVLFFNASDRQFKFVFGTHKFVVPIVHEDSLFNNTPSFEDYLSFITTTSLIFGGAFEMPMVIMVLCQIGIVSPQTFRAYRKYTYFGLSILSAIAAPSADIMTMLCLMVPLILLYEVGIVAGSIMVKRQEKRDEEEAESSEES